jgi:hypothetical protein
VPIWRLFGKTPPPPHAAWWADADAAAQAPTSDGITRLREGLTATDTDDRERREEMIDGLEQLLAVMQSDQLPRVETGHRVIGSDACHLVAPVTLADSPLGGKLFITAARVVFSSGGVKAWPWHRVRAITRIDRDLVVSVTGVGDALHVRCNTYADALVVAHMARRLSSVKTDSAQPISNNQ